MPTTTLAGFEAAGLAFFGLVFSQLSPSFWLSLMVGRVGAGIEIDPLYTDLAIERLSEATGASAVLEDGSTFEDVAEQRLGELGK